jgi:hypothetical protein
MDLEIPGLDIKGAKEKSTPNPLEPPVLDLPGDKPKRILRWIHLPGNNVRSVPRTGLNLPGN